jgi:hypothetical protein
MNRNNPLIISDEALGMKVFRYPSSEADNRYFRQRIFDFLSSPQTKTFSQFMFEAVWERNENGYSLKYCEYNERAQKVNLDPYFYEWMKRTIRKAEAELALLNSEQNVQVSDTTGDDQRKEP